jgi:hypothetical protein
MKERTPRWFKCDPAILSAEVEGMDLKSQGAYFILFRVIWQRGPLPTEEVVRLCRGTHEEVLPTMIDVDGKKTFGWLDEAMSVARCATQKASEAGKASAASRSAKPKKAGNKRSTTVEHPLNDRSASVERPLNTRSTLVEQSLNGSSTTVLSNLISSTLVSSDSSLGRGAGETEPQAHEATIWPCFDDFYNAYEKKRDRPLCEAAWAKLSQRDREAVMQAIPAYIASTPDKTYRKDPSRYLKNRAWEDEIVQPKSNGAAESVEQRTLGVAEATAQLLARRRLERAYTEGDAMQHDQGGYQHPNPPDVGEEPW